MQKAHLGGLKKKVAVLVVALLVCATTVGGTLAWRDYKQHKSNEFSGTQIKYEARLIEDFEEVFDWEVGQDIKKEIRVGNLGTAEAGYGNVYVRLQLKEFMSIGEMVFEETEERYMVAKGGQSYTAKSGKTYTFADGRYVVFDSREDALSVFPKNTVKYLEDKVTGDKGWFVETKTGDFNGQYGKHVVVKYGFGDMEKVINPGPDFCPEEERNHHGKWVENPDGTREFVTWSPECDYAVHGWGAVDATSAIDKYIEWILGANVIRKSAWDGNPVAAWILTDDGWAYWGQALAPGQTTSNLLEKVTLIEQPDGNFYYVIHTDMESLSIDEFLKDGGEGKDWDGGVQDSYVKNRPSISFNSTPPTKVKAGATVASPSVTVGPAGADQKVTWSSGNPAIAAVDPVTGVVTGVKEGGPVTIIVKAPNGARNQYSITVEAGDTAVVAVTGVSLDKSALALAPGGSGKLTASVSPANAANKNVTWSTSNAAVAMIDGLGNVTAIAPGSATITVTTVDGGKTAVCAVTVTTPTAQPLPVKPGDPFEARHDENDFENEFGMKVHVDADAFRVKKLDQRCAFKLKDILLGSDYSGITIDAGALSEFFTIETDKAGDKAILTNYIGTKSVWEAMPAGQFPTFTVPVTLLKDGYAPTTINVKVSYSVYSLYI